jgi:BRCA1-associated protein
MWCGQVPNADGSAVVPCDDSGEGVSSLPTVSPTLRPSPHSDPNPDAIIFSTGIPPVSEIFGAIRLFRDKSGMASRQSSERSTLMCVVAVPLAMAASDLCVFIGCFVEDVATVRVLRDSRASTGSYMALMQFRSQDRADAFYDAFNGRLFTSFDNQVCHVVYVADVLVDGSVAVESDGKHDTVYEKIELPTCPVCLERLDTSISGMLTTVCNHSFHCMVSVVHFARNNSSVAHVWLCSPCSAVFVSLE